MTGLENLPLEFLAQIPLALALALLGFWMYRRQSQLDEQREANRHSEAAARSAQTESLIAIQQQLANALMTQGWAIDAIGDTVKAHREEHTLASGTAQEKLESLNALLTRSLETLETVLSGQETLETALSALGDDVRKHDAGAVARNEELTSALAAFSEEIETLRDALEREIQRLREAILQAETITP